MAEASLLLNERTAARRLGVSVRLVRMWLENGVLGGSVAVSGARCIDADSVADLLGRRASMQRDDVARVLLVDDDAFLSMRCRLLIEDSGLPVQVEVAADGVQALSAIGDWWPDVVITDLEMPWMNGFELLGALVEEVRVRPRFALMVMSALSPAAIAQHGGLPEFVPRLRKPINEGEMISILRDLLRQLGYPA